MGRETHPQAWDENEERSSEARLEFDDTRIREIFFEDVADPGDEVDEDDLEPQWVDERHLNRKLKPTPQGRHHQMRRFDDE